MTVATHDVTPIGLSMLEPAPLWGRCRMCRQLGSVYDLCPIAHPLIWTRHRETYCREPDTAYQWEYWTAAFVETNRVVIAATSEGALVAAMRLLSGACELNKPEVSDE